MKETLIIFIIYSLVHGSLMSYFHDSFHVKDHYLNRFSWYKTIRLRHYAHHFNNCNYAMVFPIMDQIFGTFCKTIPKEAYDVFNNFKSTCDKRFKQFDILG